MGGPGSGRYGIAGIAAKQTVESCLSIDVNRWNREGWLKPGVSVKVTWTIGRSKASIDAQASRDNLELSYMVNGESVEYSIPIARTDCHFGESRPWFMCPGVDCDRRVGKLYLRGKYFLCRHCHELTYESCQVSKQEREWIASGLLDRMVR